MSASVTQKKGPTTPRLVTSTSRRGDGCFMSALVGETVFPEAMPKQGGRAEHMSSLPLTRWQGKGRLDSMDLLLARHPDRIDEPHSIIEHEFIELNGEGKNAAVSVMIEMLASLHENGRGCQFIKTLKGIPLSELKPNVRGGFKGGARVYFWILPDDAAGILNCEVKENDASASQQKLKVALQLYVSHQQGRRIFTERPGEAPDRS